ncbi:MAG: TRAP transporter substrate-binding protein [Paracoccaceae bacterium]
MNLKLKTIGLALAAGLTAVAAQATELKLADFQPATHPYVEKVYAPFADEIAAATNGDVTVTVFMGGELGPGPAEQYNRAVNGVADIAFSLPGYTAANFPKTLLTELPGVIDADTGTEKVLANIDMLSGEYRRVALLGLWNNAPNLLLMAEKPVRSLDELAGLKIRVPSRNAGLIVEAWGATPVSMPAPEIYNSMQTGVIDGAMIDATTLRTFKLAEVTKYVVEGMNPTVSSFFLVMNRDSFADLSDEAQAAVLEAGKKASKAANAVQLGGAAANLEAFAATEGKEVITLSPEEAAKFDAASDEVTKAVLAEADAEGLEATAYVEALQK